MTSAKGLRRDWHNIETPETRDQTTRNYNSCLFYTRDTIIRRSVELKWLTVGLTFSVPLHRRPYPSWTSCTGTILSCSSYLVRQYPSRLPRRPRRPVARPFAGCRWTSSPDWRCFSPRPAASAVHPSTRWETRVLSWTTTASDSDCRCRSKTSIQCPNRSWSAQTNGKKLYLKSDGIFFERSDIPWDILLLSNGTRWSAFWRHDDSKAKGPKRKFLWEQKISFYVVLRFEHHFFPSGFCDFFKVILLFLWSHKVQWIITIIEIVWFYLYHNWH